MEGIEKLNAELLELNDYNISAIFEYLKTKNDLIEKFNNQEKSLKQMYKFICDKAKKLAKNNVAMVNDKVVYLWAITYFNKSNEELGLNKKVEDKKEAISKTKKESKKEIKEQPKDTEKEDSKEQISMFQEVQK